MKTRMMIVVAAVAGLVANAFGEWTWEDESALKVTDGQWHLTLAATTVGERSGYSVYSVSKPVPVAANGEDLTLDLRGMPVDLISLTGTKVSAAKRFMLPDTLVSIGGFKGTGVKSIEPFFSDSVSDIAQQAFINCASLTGDVYVNCTTPLRDSFNGCSGLTSITLGKNVTEIPYAMFSGCTSVTNIDMRGGVTALRGMCFAGLTNLCEIKFASRPALNAGNTPCFRLMTDYQLKMRVPEDTLDSWKADGKTSAFEPWDEATHRSLYARFFPNDTETPLGLFTRLPNYNSYTRQWLFTYKPDVGGNSRLTIEGALADSAATPSYGMTEYGPESFPLACSSDRYVVGLNGAKRTGIVYECHAGVIDRYVDGDWTNVSTNEGCSFSFMPPEPGTYRLTWLWRKAGYSMPSVGLPTLPVVTVTTNNAPSMGTWCLEGDEISYTVEETGDGTFDRWYGDVPSDQVHSKTITVRVTKGGMSVSPCVVCSYWVFDESAHTLADGGWKITTTSGSTRDAIAVGGGNTTCVTVPSAGFLLDFTKPVLDGGRIVSFGYHAFTKYNNEDREPREIRLPKCFREIASSAFYGNAGRTTNMVFNSFPAIDEGAFPVNSRQMIWQVVADAGWTSFAEDPAKLTPWDSLDDTTRSMWKAEGKLPAGLTVGFNNQWLRFLPSAGFKMMLR